MSKLTILASGFTFTEGPRWHDGSLWFSDVYGPTIVRMEPDGALTTVATVPGYPSGLGWLPDDTLLAVSAVDKRLVRVAPDGTQTTHADISHLATWYANDMVVDGLGRAYVGNQGFDLAGGAPPATTVLVLVEPDGTARTVADDVLFPNGSVITPDGKTLIVAETFAAKLTAFTIADDGSLVDRRLFAALDGAAPDGIALDAEGAVWVASPISHEVIRVAAGGEVLDRVVTGAHEAIACALGGADRRTLYVCTSSTHDPREAMARRDARIEAVEVDVRGAGWP